MLRNSLWNTIGNIFYYFSQWLTTILVVHLTGYADAGILSIAMSTSSTFAAVALFSMRNFQVTDTNREYSDDEYVGSRIFTCFVALVICVIVSFVGNEGLRGLCIDLYMLIRVVEAGVDVLHGVDQKYNRYDYIGISLLLRGGIMLVGFLIGSCFFNLPVALVLIAMGEAGVLVLFDLRKVCEQNEEGLHPIILNRHIVELLRRCFPLVVFNFLLSAENMLSKLVLQDVCGNTDLGIYSSVATPTLVVQVFATVVFAPFLPRISEMFRQKDSERLKHTIHLLYRIFVIAIVVIIVGATLLGRWALQLLFGKDILEYYELFMPVVMVTCLNAVIIVVSGVLIAFRQIKVMVYGIGIDFIIFIVGVYPIIKNFGMNGASYAQIIAFVLYIPFMVILCERTAIKNTEIE